MNPIIFLDIDGPINSIKNQKYQRYLGKSTNSGMIKLPKKNFIALKHIIDNTNASVVISSNWRLGYVNSTPSKAYVNFCSQAREYGIYPIGWTPAINKNKKGLEIKSWIDYYENLYNCKISYIVIEDHIENVIDLHKGHVIYTDSYTGLDMNVANIAIDVLKSIQYKDSLEFV